MWKSRLDGISPISRSAGAALMCTIFTQHFASRQSELYSETACWMIVPILVTISKPSDNINAISRTSFLSRPGTQVASSSTSLRTAWLVAAGLTIACCYRAEVGMIGLLPTLTPLVFLAEKYLRPQLQASRIINPGFFSAFASTIWGTTIAAIFAVFALSDWNLQKHALSIVPTAGLLIAYIALIPRTIERSYLLPLLNIKELIVPFSLRLVAVLGVALVVQTVAFGLPRDAITSTLSLGLAKALSWYFTIRTARETSWCIATAIATFSIASTRDPFMQSSELQALSQVIASFLALSQIVYMLPKQGKTRIILWAFILISLIPYLANLYAISNAKGSAATSFGHSEEHPIEALVHSSKASFEHALQKQSQNYTAADAEYRRRYGVEPPPGFEAWYEFAAANESPIIDEFDAIFDMVSPFWKLSGKEVIQIMADVQHTPNIELWHCGFSADRAHTRCTHPRRSFDRHIGLSLNKLLGDLGGIVPDVSFLVNHLDEPRVLLPPFSLLQGGADSHRKTQFEVSNLKRQPTWDELTKFCAYQQNNESDSVQDDTAVEAFALPFVADRQSAMNLCQHPEYSATYGLFMSPTSLRMIEGLVPVLTTGSPSTMGDLLFPSPAYMESEFQYDEAQDIEWDKKVNNLYWAGSTTGSFAADDQWRNHHRQRFVKLAQNLDLEPHSYLRKVGGVVSRVKTSFLNGRLFDVAFTRIFQCEQKYCRDQRAYFNVKSWADKGKALRSRLVFDLDGNGISGRYYKLLASRSVPLKQTLLREWHDERLMPWVHYIPVSQGMEELPELVFYLTSTKAGQARAKEIAGQGRDWFFKAFREIDLGIYTSRLLLELARLQDPDREAS